MKSFEHGSHRPSVMTMSLEEARESGMTDRLDLLGISWHARSCYAYCPTCSLDLFSLAVLDLDDNSLETDGELEERTMVSFMEAFDPSCESVVAEMRVREVMES